MKKYILKAPFGSVLAPMGAVDEQQLRDYGVQITDKTWHAKFKDDPIEDVLGYFRSIGYSVEVFNKLN